ncbi:hypothetical protein [Paenibacillus sp. 1P03SA]|uniref:hypothetical protein n=1 Tax=Paenibacillus sp. 1P03SA TaxID=3132294 RepID=UPI0039A1368D
MGKKIYLTDEQLVFLTALTDPCNALEDEDGDKLRSQIYDKIVKAKPPEVAENGIGDEFAGDRECPDCEEESLIEISLTKRKCLKCKEIFDEEFLDDGDEG